MKRLFLGAGMLCLAHIAFAQKQFSSRNELWLLYSNQSRFTNRSGAWFDFQWRQTDKFQPLVTIERLGYTYFVNNNLRLAAAYGYATQYSDGHAVSYEHQPYEQIQWFKRKRRLTTMQWLRLEERLRKKISKEPSDHGVFSYRLRYNFWLTFPLQGQLLEPKTIFALLNNEIFINFGKSIDKNYFDQNRTTASIGYQLTRRLSANLGYMYIFQKLSGGDDFLSIHALRLSFVHNLDFRND